jgi:hypothetical protein
MEGFKSLPKMQCFKDGGAVKSAYSNGGKAYKNGGHSESKEMKKDIAQDKKIVKKALAMHDKQSHEGEKTDLKKLNKGGRMKKEGGCVARYQAGGSIKMKKDSGDKDDIKKIKLTKPKKAKAPSAAMKVKESNIKESMPSGGLDTIMPPSLSSEMPSPPMMRKGGNVKKCSTGGALKNVDAEDNPGLAELPTHVRNKMGYKRNGGKIC